MRGTKRWPLARRSKAVAIKPRHRTQFGSSQSSASGAGGCPSDGAVFTLERNHDGEKHRLNSARPMNESRFQPRKRREKKRMSLGEISTRGWSDSGGSERDQTERPLARSALIHARERGTRLRRDRLRVLSTDIQTASQVNSLLLAQPCRLQNSRRSMWTCRICTNRSSLVLTTNPFQNSQPR